MILRLFHRRWVQLAVVTAAFVGLVAALLPYGLSAGLVAWLRDQGARRITVGDVSFNLFTARFSLHRLAVDEGTRAEMGVAAIEGDLSQRALLDGRLLFDRLVVRNARIAVSHGDDGSAWRVGPILIGAAGTAPRGASKPAAVGIRSLRVIDSAVDLSRGDGRLDIRLASGRIENLLPWLPDGAAGLAVTGTLNGSKFALSGTARPFAPRIALAGKLKAQDLALDSLKLVGAAGLAPPEGSASLDGRLTAAFEADGRFRADFEGAIEGRALRLSRPDWPEPALAERLDWSGRLSVAALNKGAPASYDAKGRLAVGGLALGLPAGYRLRLDQARLDGVAVTGLDTGALQGFDAQGMRLERRAPASGPSSGEALSIDHLRGAGLAFAPATGISLGSLAADGGDGKPGVAATAPNGYRISLNDLAAAELRVPPAGTVSLKSLGGHGLKVAPPAPAKGGAATSGPLSAAALAISDVAASAESGIAAGAVVVEGARVAFLNDARGFHGPHDILTPDDRTATPSGQPAGRVKKGTFGIRIAQLALAKDSVAVLRDETVKPAFAAEWRLDEALFKDIDSSRPDKPMQLRLSARNRTYGAFEAHGTARPFADRLALDIEARLERIDLPLLSPYLDREMGYVFKSGEGNLSARIKLDDGVLDAHSKVGLRAMEVAPTRPEAAQAAARQLSMPVEAALALLRDKNNDIQLEIPVSGDPRAPKFDLGQVIAKATTSAIQGASMGFLKIALQPFGAALLVGEIAQKIAASIRLDPAVFEPGNAAVEARHEDFLARVAKTLGERPALRIKLCGRSAAADRAALAARRKLAPDKITDADLTALAGARADAVKGYFVGRFRIDPSRIIACGPEIDREPDARPRVEFLI